MSVLNKNISCFKNYHTAEEPKIVNLLTWLTSDKYADKVDRIREMDDKIERDIAKAMLPAITPSGLFTKRAESGLVQHSGLISFDIDFKENSHIKNYHELKSQLSNLPEIAYCGLSVSGRGYWGLIPIGYPDKHKEYFQTIEKFFQGHGLIIDPAPKNVASLRGYSYDPDAYFNHEARTLYKYQVKQVNRSRTYSVDDIDKKLQVEYIIDQIVKYNVDIAPTQKDWTKIAFALADEFGEEGLRYFLDVSSAYAGVHKQDPERHYEYCLKNANGKTHINTFFWYAHNAHLSANNGKFIGVVLDAQRKKFQMLKDGRLIELSPQGVYPATWDLN